MLAHANPDPPDRPSAPKFPSQNRRTDPNVDPVFNDCRRLLCPRQKLPAKLSSVDDNDRGSNSVLPWTSHVCQIIRGGCFQRLALASTERKPGAPSNPKQGQTTRLATGLRIFSPSLPSSSSSKPGRVLMHAVLRQCSRLEHLELEASGFLKSRAWTGGRCPERTTLLATRVRGAMPSLSLHMRRVKDLSRMAETLNSKRCHTDSLAAPESLPASCSQPGPPLHAR